MDTNQKLLDYHQDNIELRKTVVGRYLNEKINTFEQANKHKLDLLIKTLNDLQAEYFEHDENKHLVFEGEGRDRKPKPQFGMDPEEYTARRNKILAIPVEIKFKLK